MTAIFARSRSGSASASPPRTSGSSTSDSVTICPGTIPITRARRPLAPRDAEDLRPERSDANRVLHPLRDLGARDLADGPAALEHERRDEELEVGQQEQVGLAAGRDRAEVIEPVVGRRIVRGEDERVDRVDPVRDGVADDRVHVPVDCDVLGLAVVGAERHPVRAELLHERDQRLEVPRGRRLADQQPHPGPQPLASLLGRGRLVVGADTRRRVRLEVAPEDARRVAVDVCGESELRELVLVAGDDAGEVHHLGEPDHAPAAEQRVEVADRQRPPRRLERRRGDARRRHEVEVERQVGRRVEQPVDAVGAEHVRDLVRVRDDGGRPEREHEPRELVDERLRRLDVDVRVDEPGHDPLARRVDGLASFVVAEPGDPAVGDGDIDVEPFAGEDGEHLAAADDGVGGLVPTRDGEAS